MMVPMTTPRLKKIGLALCLMVSLFVGQSAAACACSHHEPVKKVAESDCHSHRGKSPASAKDIPDTKDSENATSIATDCTCFVQSATPIVAVQQTNKKSKSKHSTAGLLLPASEINSFLAVHAGASLSASDDPISYSNTLASLRPSRAPPRL